MVCEREGREHYANRCEMRFAAFQLASTVAAAAAAAADKKQPRHAIRSIVTQRRDRLCWCVCEIGLIVSAVIATTTRTNSFWWKRWIISILIQTHWQPQHSKTSNRVCVAFCSKPHSPLRTILHTPMDFKNWAAELALLLNEASWRSRGTLASRAFRH